MSCHTAALFVCRWTAQVCVIVTFDVSAGNTSRRKQILLTRCEHFVISHIADHVIIDEALLVYIRLFSQIRLIMRGILPADFRIRLVLGFI